MRFFATMLGTVIMATALAATASPGHGGGGFAGGRPGDPSAVDRTIRIEARDIEYSRERIQVRAGETVRFVVTNSGAIEHDFTIGTPAMHRAHQEEMKEMMHSGSMETHDDGNAIMLKPGETKELVWRFANAQNLEFACNVPGHYEAGMKGDFLVVDSKESGARR